MDETKLLICLNIFLTFLCFLIVHDKK